MPTDVRTTAYIDGTQMLYRAEFGFPTRIRNRTGADVTGLFGFLALTRKSLINSPVSPTHAIVVFDADAPTHRSQLDSRYRASRTPLAAGSEHNPFRHLPWILQALQVWGMESYEHESAEADDVIASLIGQGVAGHGRAIVVSRDKDFHQLISSSVTQWDTARGSARGWTTPEVVFERYGVLPNQWCDFVALVGDQSDGMPGVRGVGPVTAARILRAGPTLDDAAEELTAPELADALHQRDIHRLRADLLLPRREPAPLPSDGLATAPSLLDALGLWGSAYP